LERFTPIVGDDAPTSRIVDRLADEDPARLAAGAVDLETELRRRAAGIDKDIEEVDEHQQLLVDQLVAIARDAVKLLAAVQARSRMPDDLAEWSKRRFIEIRHDPLPDDPAVLADRIGRVVDLLVDQQVTPDADQLLYRAPGGRRGSAAAPAPVPPADAPAVESGGHTAHRVHGQGRGAGR